MEVFFKTSNIADQSLYLLELNSDQAIKKRNYDIFYDFKNSFDECFINSNLNFCTNNVRLISSHSIEKYPTLFLDFADLDISNKTELKNFILNYGFLTGKSGYKEIQEFSGISLLNDKSDWSKEIEDLKNNVYTEPLSSWVLFQIHLRRLIRYWRALHCYHNNSVKLETFIDIDDKNPMLINDEVNRYFSYYFSPKNKFINFKKIEIDFEDQTFKQINVNDYIKTRYPSGLSSLLRPNINEYKVSSNEIINFMNHYLKFELDYLLQISSHSFSIIPNFKKLSLLGNKNNTGTHLIYNSPMGAMLFQLSNAISLNKKFKRCLECQKWMEFSTQGRLGKKYCNSNCRASAHRRRESIKLLYEMASLQGNFSLKKYFNNFCKSFNKGPDEFLIWRKNIDKQFQDKQKVKSLLDNITNNVLNNLNVFTSTASIAEHLDLEHDYIISINIYEAFKVAAVKPKISAPYIDWDYN